jgi:small subunit ribosomal protein S4
MARYSDAVCRLCRREGMKLYLKGERCFKEKCSFETRKGKIPGQHGAAKAKKPTGYALQLREKQKVKRIYGVLEKQFSLYFKHAESKKGVTGHNLLSFLESRLDNVVFRLGFCPSRAAARQMVMHGHILVNGKRVVFPASRPRPARASRSPPRLSRMISLSPPWKPRLAAGFPSGSASMPAPSRVR